MIRRDDGTPVCERCVVADGPVARMRGLLGRRELPPGEGILLRPAGSVHTFFMRFPIDVVWLDRDLRVTSIRPHLVPWRMAFGPRAKAALELTAGESERRGLSTGDQLDLDTPR